jgi:hypothetical protein
MAHHSSTLALLIEMKSTEAGQFGVKPDFGGVGG